MHLFRRWMRFALGFSKREINGVLVLLPLLIIIIASKPLYHAWKASSRADFSTESAQLDSIYEYWGSMRNSQKTSEIVTQHFVFDPNHASFQELVGLGITENIASRIIKYRERGGRFKTKNDLLKIYGFDTLLYTQLYGFIKLPSTEDRNIAIRKNNNNDDKEIVSKVVIEFDINKADTSEFIKIKGIGPTLANRIIKYRDLLGGFVRMSQLSEVYGLDSAVVNRMSSTCFVSDFTTVRKIDLNAAGERELSAHPYISRTIAKAIVAYRFQHGAFVTIEEIRKIPMVDDNLFERIFPYLIIKQ